MASWLVYLTPAQVVCVQALARDMMCCVPRKDIYVICQLGGPYSEKL